MGTGFTIALGSKNIVPNGENTMKLSSAEKQKAYRDRKYRQDFMSNDFYVTQCLKEAEARGKREDFVSLFDETYDIAYEQNGNAAELVRRIAFVSYSVLSALNALSNVSDRRGEQ